MNAVVPYGGGAVASDAVALANSGPASSGSQVSHPSLEGLPSDITLGSDDKPIAASFAAAMAGAPREFVHRALRWYGQHVARIDAAQTNSDREDRTAARVAMANEWGTLAAANFRAIRQYFGTLPVAVQEALSSAELEDGTLLLNSPSGLRWLFDLARAPSRNAYGGRPLASAHEELQQITEVMRKDRKRYNRDERMQARYRELLELTGAVR